MEGESR